MKLVSSRFVRAVASACAVVALVALAGCGGPERAPRQPVTGVDRPAEDRAPNPHDVEPEKERESRTQN